jgi:DNA-binding MarR family transcriptional regulator
MESRPRAEQLEELTREMRLMSSFDALLSHAIASEVGMHNTDIETMDLLNIFGPMTAGELSARTGLSSGATTRLIDRLERVGFVRRTQDAADRRRVIIELVPENLDELMQLFGPLTEKLDALWGSYSDEQLSTIIDFARRSNQIVREENARLRATSRHDD